MSAREFLLWLIIGTLATIVGNLVAAAIIGQLVKDKLDETTNTNPLLRLLSGR